MKKLIHHLNPKYALIFLTLLLFSALVLFLGPQLKISNKYPLYPIDKRLYTIALTYLSTILFFLLKPQSEKKPAPLLTPQALEKRQSLQKRFEGAVQFLKKTFISKHGKKISLAELPWFLLVGPEGAGKTTLLANANINFVLTKQFKQERITSSSALDWWATRDIVLIDTPGAYLKENNRFLWESFLKLAQQFRGKKAIQTVVIALPLPELIKHQNQLQKKQIAGEIKKTITLLQNQFGNELSFYFVLTKCDLLPGFMDFFSDGGAEELSQAWGVTLPPADNNAKIHEIFANRFNALIKRINLQLISRLHQERNSNARPAIKDFPLHIERLKDNMAQFLKALGSPQLKIQGVFLTSATQGEAIEQSGQSQIINGNTHQSLQLLRNPSLPTKAYFIRQLLLQGLLSQADATHSPVTYKKKWRNPLAYTLAIASILFSTLFLGYDFQKGILRTYETQNNLSQYRYSIKQDEKGNIRLIKTLPLLNSLQATADYNHSHANNPLAFYSDKSQKASVLFYQEALQSIALPELKNSFESYLSEPSHKDPALLYAAFKGYLMLGDVSHLDVDYVSNITTLLFLDHLNKQSQQEFADHLQKAFSLKAKPLALNQKLIKQIRHDFASLSSQDLGLIILKNSGSSDNLNTINQNFNMGDPPIFSFSQNIHPVSKFFTVKSFREMSSEMMNQAAYDALQGNWIIGQADILSNEASIKALAQQLKSRYIANYTAAWEGLLTNLTLAKPNDLAQTDNVISGLMSNTSPLLQILESIKDNTANETILSASPKLRAFNRLLTDAATQENTLYHLFINLRQLHFYLQSILTAPDPDKAAFEATKIRMVNADDPITHLREFAEQSPEPIRGWLNTLAKQSWNTLLVATSHYIENAWQLNVMPIYQAQFGQDDKEMDLQQVANFIGKQGKLALFYTHYLKPFVDDSNKSWVFKSVDNHHLQFSPMVLSQIQEAGKLQNLSRYMLFTQGRNNPALKQLHLPVKLLADKE